jgi:hypothetical protein
MARAKNEKIVMQIGCFGNLFVALCSFTLGFYSLHWSLTATDGSDYDVANSAIIIVNGLVNFL